MIIFLIEIVLTLPEATSENIIMQVDSMRLKRGGVVIHVISNQIWRIKVA